MFLLHNHTEFSNASRGFADSSMSVEDLIVRSKELGLSGVAITDHEITGSYVKAERLAKKHDVKVIYGNEIYLVSDKQDYDLRNDYQKGMFYPHFLLLALDWEGVHQLWQLSELAWRKSYWRNGLIRTTTRMDEVERIIGQNQGHIIASTACLGGFLGKTCMERETTTDEATKALCDRKINAFLKWCMRVFGKENFYLEMQPNDIGSEQDIYNHNIKELSDKYNIPYIITTDSHYAKKDDIGLHSAFLNAKADEGNEREVESIYKTAYMMDEQELRSYFSHWDKADIDKAIENTEIIGNRVQPIDLFHKQVVPKRPIPKDWVPNPIFFPQTDGIKTFLQSTHEQDRALLYLVEKGMKEKLKKEDYKETFDRLEEELTEIWVVSEGLGDKLSAYFVTMNKNIEICWNEANSIIGVGRGSGVSSIINYLLDITQINPLKTPFELPFWRFISRARIELPDIDFDTPEHLRNRIFQCTCNYYESLGGTVFKCCTYGTLGGKSAIQVAGKGLGYNADDMLAIAQLIKTERGETWTITDMIEGNKKKNRKPQPDFENAIKAYDGLLELALKLEGLISSRGIHASGLFIINDEVTKYGSLMTAPDGTLTSQYDLHDAEHLGMVKYDLV